MKKWIVQYHAGMCGTDEAVAVTADTEQEAINQVTQEAWEHFWNHNDEDVDEDCEEGNGSVNGVEAELDIWAEEYDPKLHDGMSVGGGWTW